MLLVGWLAPHLNLYQLMSHYCLASQPSPSSSLKKRVYATRFSVLLRPNSPTWRSSKPAVNQKNILKLSAFSNFSLFSLINGYTGAVLCRVFEERSRQGHCFAKVVWRYGNKSWLGTWSHIYWSNILTLSQTVAFGDAENDIGLVRTAKLGVCMKGVCLFVSDNRK